MFALLAIFATQSDPIRLSVDATDAARGIFHVREVIPASGSATLKYPKWIPGEHGPSGPVFDVVNVHFLQNGREVEWRHDPLDLFTFNVNSVSGPLEARFDYVAPRHNVATRNLARIKWNRLVLLPEGKASTVIAPSLRAPEGWSIATALDFERTGKLETTTAERLIDSPAVIGKYYRQYRLEAPGGPPATLEVFTEKPAEVPEATVEGHRRLYKEALAFFGVAHFRHYQFLLTFSGQGAGEGLEHNECSEDGLDLGALKNEASISDLDAHEFAHSWCGKYRRPHGLSNLNFDVPMNDEDLWVYEGFTQFAGFVLSARSRMWSPEIFRDGLAEVLAEEESHTGRSWRPLEDTAIFGSLINTTPDAWFSRRRGSDYYNEMVSNWLEADGIIRRESHGARSIDNFAEAFFGGSNRGPEIRSFTRRELYDTLNKVQPHDWEGFFTSRVFKVRPRINDGWLERAGWSLILNGDRNAFEDALQVGDRKELWVLKALGLAISDGEIRDVQEGSASDKAKLAPGMKIISVNGVKYSVDAMEKEIQNTSGSSKPMELVVDDYDVIRTVIVDYHDGLKFGHLKRNDGSPDLITPVASPRNNG